MKIQISWLLKKPTDLDLQCLQKRAYPGSAGQGLNDLDYMEKHQYLTGQIGCRYGLTVMQLVGLDKSGYQVNSFLIF